MAGRFWVFTEVHESGVLGNWSRKVLVLYRERSGEESFRTRDRRAPERFRYSDLKEAVVESSSYVF